MGDSKMEKLIAELEAMMQYELYKAKKDHLHGQFFALRAETLAYTIALLKEREKTESKAQGGGADRMSTYRYYRYGYLLRPPGLGCPYVDGDCSVDALLDALDVVERLEKKVKKLKKKGENRPDG